MATKYVKFVGPAKWAKVYKPDDKYNVYSINLYLDAKTKESYIKSGIQGKIKEDEDGEFVSFRRPASKIIKGDLVNLGPPKVLSKDKSEFDEIIGNGSIVECDVSVYDTIKGKGHTLNAVRVIDHKEYHRDEVT